MAVSYRKIPVLLESLFNFEYCEFFNKSTYFEEHLQTAASENVFTKIVLLRDKPRIYQHQYQEQVKMFAFILWLVSLVEVCIHSHAINISLAWCVRINSKHWMSTRVNQKKIKRSIKEYIMWTCFKLWPTKTILRKL